MTSAAPDQLERLRSNLTEVRERIAAAARRSGRTEADITLVGATKYVPPNVARQLVQTGHLHLGESRPQELWKKAEALADLPVSWHLIGHLQRNKVKRTLPFVSCIHSVDSLALLEEIDRHAAMLAPSPSILLEVNMSGEAAKTGMQPADLQPLFASLVRLKHVRIDGLMTMAGLEGGLDRARREFAALRELRDQLSPNTPHQVALRHLSMGMSGDYEVAIEEGATMVRVGSALFEGIA